MTEPSPPVVVMAVGTAGNLVADRDGSTLLPLTGQDVIDTTLEELADTLTGSRG